MADPDSVDFSYLYITDPNSGGPNNGGESSLNNNFNNSNNNQTAQSAGSVDAEVRVLTLKELYDTNLKLYSSPNGTTWAGCGIDPKTRLNLRKTILNECPGSRVEGSLKVKKTAHVLGNYMLNTNTKSIVEDILMNR